VHKITKRILIGIAAFMAILVLIVVGVGMFFDVNRYKPQIEAAVAQSSGMKLKLNGPTSLRAFPQVRIVLRDVNLSNQGNEVFAANEITVTPRLIPFLTRREVVIDQITLMNPKIRIEKNAQGRFNFEQSKQPSKNAAGQKGSEINPGQIHTLKIKEGELTYLDRSSGQKTTATGINARLSEIDWEKVGNESKSNTKLLKSLSFHGNFKVQSLKSASWVASNLTAQVQGDQGVLRLDRTEVQVFGGVMRGSGQVDLRSPTPKLKLVQTASELDLSQMAKKGKSQISGKANATINLSAAGNSTQALSRTIDGNVSIRSQNITLTGIDVDALAGKLQAAEGMNLIKLGSGLISDIPVGSSKKTSVIRNLVSDWRITQGIAQAKDVAFSTANSTIAFQGRLNLAKRTYQGFHIATVDSKGCAKSKIEIAGSLKRPHPVLSSIGSQIPRSILKSAEPQIGSEGSQIAGVFGGADQSEPKANAPSSKPEASADCDPFYAGSAIKSG
jgi:uncharacterized protein involved in outer membrane biogenesis